jgi:hypothetical protein
VLEQAVSRQVLLHWQLASRQQKTFFGGKVLAFFQFPFEVKLNPEGLLPAKQLRPC